MTDGMEPRRVGDAIIAPRRAESEDGATIGDGWIELHPGDPDYDMWDQYLRSRGDAWVRRTSDRASRRGSR